jgi:hypothetical protein
MSDIFLREPAVGGDLDSWGLFEEAQNHPSLSINTIVLYNNGGSLYRKPGQIGLDNGSNKGVVTLTGDVGPISLAGLTASRWARVEVSVVGTTPSVTLTSIAAGTDPAVIPAAMAASYNYAKGGFYFLGTARLIGLVWVNAAGNLEGIVNCGNGFVYSGYATSDDAADLLYYFSLQKNDLTITMNTRATSPQVGAFTAYPMGSDNFFPVTTAAGSFNATVPAAGTTYNGKKIRIQKVDTGAGIVTAVRSGADTFLGATAFPMRVAGDFIELWCDGTAWRVIDSLATIDSAALAINTPYNLAHGLGVIPRKNYTILKCGTAELGFSIGDEWELSLNWISGGVNYLHGRTKDATNIICRTDSGTFNILRKDTGALAGVTLASWYFRCRYSL